MTTQARSATEWVTDRAVLLIISIGLITIILSIVAGIFLTSRELPNWAENVLISIGTAAILKLGDCLSTLHALSSGKSNERLANKLGESAPVVDQGPAPKDAIEAAEQVATAAEDKRDEIKGT